MVKSFNAISALSVLIICSTGTKAQSSWARIFWVTSHNGWTQQEGDVYFYADVLESTAVQPDSERITELGWTQGSVFLVRRTPGLYAYWDSSPATEDELFAAWPVDIPYNFVSDDELQGTAPSLPVPDFSNVLPSIIDPNRLNQITPGDVLEIETPTWSATATNSRSTWLGCYQKSNGLRVWEPSSGGPDGVMRQFDTASLLANTEYVLYVTYSSRYLDSFVGPLLGHTYQESAFDRVTVYLFTTLDAPCPADLSGDGQLDFFDVSGFLTYFQLGDLNADMNDDGVLNFFDVSAYLSAFASGCP